MVTRREMILKGAALAGASAALTQANPARAAAAAGAPGWERSYVGGPELRPLSPGLPGKDYTPVTTPNGSALPWKAVDGVKVFHLVAEEVLHEFAPGITANCCGYNGSVHGPTLEAVEGDRVRVYVTNKLGAPTTVHWHGVYLPAGMDGAMSVGVFQLLQAKREQIAAAAGYVDLLRDYWSLRAEVEQLAAGRLPRSMPVLSEASRAMALDAAGSAGGGH